MKILNLEDLKKLNIKFICQNFNLLKKEAEEFLLIKEKSFHQSEINPSAKYGTYLFPVDKGTVEILPKMKLETEDWESLGIWKEEIPMYIYIIATPISIKQNGKEYNITIHEEKKFKQCGKDIKKLIKHNTTIYTMDKDIKYHFWYND